MKSIPAIPMIAVLKNYAVEKKLPFRMNRWEEIVRCFMHYRRNVLGADFLTTNK